MSQTQTRRDAEALVVADANASAPTAREAAAQPRRSTVAWVVAVLAVSVAVVAVVWAVLTVLRPAEDPLEAAGYATVAVAPGEVGSSLSLNTVAVWEPTPVGVNGGAGVVTGVCVSAGDEVRAGDVLYTVDLRPVVIAEGAVPAFRPIGRDTRGSDVAQVQRMLAALGYDPGPADGNAGAGTTAAIRAWQKESGVPQTGVVDLGDVIFVPSLPTRVSLDTDVIARGKTVTGGEEVVRGLPAAPVFTIPVTDAQAAMIPTGTPVQMTAPDGTVWDAVTTDQTVDEMTQTVIIGLTGADGGTVCGDECGLVPVTGEARLSSLIVTVPTVEGLVVPSAALVTDAAGQIAVVNEAGVRVPVSVVSSARGMSVIEGVEQGTSVRVPAVEDAG